MNRWFVCLFVAMAFAGGTWAASKLDARGPAVTHYLDANTGARTNGSARRMTELHARYHEQGYQVIDVDPYIEDGDLEGFFITYRKM
jgi:hypothetical protein